MIQKLNFDSDERGVSEVLGAILVFGILVVLLGIIQTQAVPAQNQEVEFQHNLDVQGDLIEFRQTASDVTADGNERSVTFKSGTGYPSRLLFFNPPRVQGTVETSEQAEVTLENVEATNDEVNNYFEDTNNGPGGNTLTLDTRRLQYRVNYNELPSEPVSRYEYGFLYNYFEDEDEYIVQNNGNVIDGTTINLRFLAGDYSKTSGSEQSLDVQPVSAPARSVRVTGTAGNNIFITLPTALDINVWQNEYGGAVAGITPGPGDTVRIELDGSQTYNLRMSALALESGVDEPGPYYIVPTRDGVTNAAPSETASIQYEVRDEYNNPVADAEVEITDPNGVVASGTTDDEGRFSTTVTTAESKQFTAELVGASATEAECSQATDSRCEADFLVQVPALNLNPSAGVQLSGATTQDPDPNTRTGTGGAVDCTLVSCKADVTFENTNSQEVGMDLLRVNHYNPDPQGHTDVDVSIGSSMITAEIGGASVDATPLRNIPATSSETYTFTFQGEVHEGDYFVVTIIYDNNERALYFISPKD